MIIDHAMINCWSYAMIIDHCHERLLIIHDDYWLLPWKAVDHTWSTFIGLLYCEHYTSKDDQLLHHTTVEKVKCMCSYFWHVFHILGSRKYWECWISEDFSKGSAVIRLQMSWRQFVCGCCYVNRSAKVIFIDTCMSNWPFLPSLYGVAIPQVAWWTHLRPYVHMVSGCAGAVRAQ